MTRIEIVNEVHANIDFFRDKWDKFCKWVESCAEQLARYQLSETGKFYAVSNKYRHRPEEKWRILNERGKLWWRTCRVCDKGWAKWITFEFFAGNDYHTKGLTLPNPHDIYAPPDVVDPVLWVFGRSNPREPDPDYQKEQLLVDCALLAVTHDATELVNRIYSKKTCQTTYFDCASFRHELTAELDRMDRDGRLRRAWNDIRPYTLAYPKDAVSADLAAKGTLKTNGQAAQEPNGQGQTSANGGAHVNVNIQNSNVTMGDISQTQNLATGNRNSIGKQTPTSLKNKKNIKKTITASVLFLAALLTVLQILFGWMGGIWRFLTGE